MLVTRDTVAEIVPWAHEVSAKVGKYLYNSVYRSMSEGGTPGGINAAAAACGSWAFRWRISFIVRQGTSIGQVFFVL